MLELSADVRSKIPEETDYEGTRKMLSTDPSPLNVVLLQEIQRYNSLLQVIRRVSWQEGCACCLISLSLSVLDRDGLNFLLIQL